MNTKIKIFRNGNSDSLLESQVNQFLNKCKSIISVTALSTSKVGDIAIVVVFADNL